MHFTRFNTIFKRLSVFALTLCLGTCFLSSCKKDKVITSSSAKISLSADSVLFDTVFTTVGSTVRAFLVRNTNSQPIVISSIKLGGNYLSPFKINVDGIPGSSFSNIRIPAKDSIFVFVTCTLGPNNNNPAVPLVIEDSLIFTTNGNVQNVYLEAWGQDAYYFKPNVFPAYGPAYSVIPCNSIWTSAKPYVIYGYAVVDSGCTLTIQQGTKVYFHNNGVLWVYKDGTLNVSGAQGNPVTFQGDRLEPEYQTVPGQWGEIWLSPQSIDNNISWAVIKNGTIGVEADTVGDANPTLTIDHTIIKSMSEFGLLGEGARITGHDLLIEDCQYSCLNLSIGGGYRFNQCTFADYWTYSQRQTSLLVLNNHYTDINNASQVRNLDSANFYNCIVWGSGGEEINPDMAAGGSTNYFFANCLLKTQRSLTDVTHYLNCNASDPLFLNTNEPPLDDYRVDSTASAALKQGTNTYGNLSPDLQGDFRNYPSTIGAYEK